MRTTIPLSLAKGYVCQWGVWQALRELLQNSLDHGDYDVYYKAMEQELHIISKCVSLGEEILLLGNGSKSGNSTQRGEYGEGLKLSLLVLLREGYEVEIINGNKIWKPLFKYNPDFNAECLHIALSQNTVLGNNNFHIVVSGITQDTIEMVAERYIPTPNHTEYEIVAEHNGRFAFKQEEPSVYVGGLYVCRLPKRGDKKYHYSYNFLPQDVQLDRDRNTVSEFSVSWDATNLFKNSGRWDILAELASEEALDISDHIHVGTSGRSDAEIKQIVKQAEKAFFKKHGSDAHPIDESLPPEDKALAIKDAVDAGYKPVIIKSALYNMLPAKATTQRVVGTERKTVLDLLYQFRDNYNLTEQQWLDIMEIIEIEEIKNGKKT